MIFEKVSFDANDYKSAVADGKTLYIYLHSMKDPMHVDFKSGADALDALKRLDADVTANRTSEGTKYKGRGNTVETTTSNLFDSLSGLFQKGKAKVDDVVNGTSLNALIFQMAADQAISTVKSKAEDLSQKLEDVLGTVTANVAGKKSEFQTTFGELLDVIKEIQEGLDDNGETAEPSEPKKGWTRHMTNDKTIFKGDFFSGLADDADDKEVPAPGSVGAPDEPLIGDLTASELKELIAQFVDGAMANPKTQKIFGNIYEIFGKHEATAAVENLKKLIFEMAVTCPDAKLSEVLQRFLG